MDQTPNDVAFNKIFMSTCIKKNSWTNTPPCHIIYKLHVTSTLPSFWFNNLSVIYIVMWYLVKLSHLFSKERGSIREDLDSIRINNYKSKNTKSF